MAEELIFPRVISSTYIAYGRDASGWYQQDEPDGPKTYGEEAEATMRFLFPSWMLDELETQDS